MKSQLLKQILAVKTYLIVIIMALLLGPLYAQDCKTDLNPYRGFNTKSVDRDGTTFKLTLKNYSGEAAIYDLEVADGDCSSFSSNNFSNNVPLSMSFSSDINSNLRQIKVEGNSEKIFHFNLSQQPRTPVSQWRCIKVIARNTNCESDIVSTTLQVFIQDSKRSE